jgi:hypothetical protein
MIRHILFISFSDDATEEQIDKIRFTFLQIKEKVDGIENVEWGINDSQEGKNRGFTHCVLMTFSDEQARQRYLPHPAHEKLKIIFRPVLRDILVLDYTL